MLIKKRFVVLAAVVGLFVGWLSLGGTAALFHYTSSTEFCVSCHSMTTPYEEYQGSIHFTNAKGIRAECADCHIPSDPIDYLITKVRASKDIYHEFVSGKLDSDEDYENHRLAMAETVWQQLKENDSATCRSCHTLEAMDPYEQSEEAEKMHLYAKENRQTCIECHKGVAHFAPEPEMDSAAFDLLLELAEKTPADANVVYPLQQMAMGELGTINPTTKLTVINAEGNKRDVKIHAYQMKGAEQLLYFGRGQRAIVASLTEQGVAALKTGEYLADEYGNEWRSAELIAQIEGKVLDSQQPIWQYAQELDNVYCATCHAIIPANHFTINAWGPVAKGMGDRTDISEENLQLLTKYFQHHAKDAVNH